MSGIFDGMDVAQDAAKEVDVLGGGFAALESGIYQAIVDVAYLHIAASGAKAVQFNAKIDGKEYRETVYFSSNAANGLRTYYIDKNDGSKKNLAGFAILDSLCIIAAGKPFTQMVTETKIVNVYDYDVKKEVPTNVEVLSELTGKGIYIAITNTLENKSKKVGNEYVATAETRNVNAINKVFHPTTKMTTVEMAEGASVPAFFEAWETKNKGVVINKVKPVAAGAPVVGTAPAASVTGQTSLFDGS